MAEPRPLKELLAEIEMDTLGGGMVSYSDAREMAERLRAIDMLHVPDIEGLCEHCGYGWPCSTRKALDGER